MIQFKTTKQAQLDGIVATLEELYSCKPIGSVVIGKAYNMEHAQVLKYLHQAKLIGRAKPVLSGPGGVIRGWIPGTIAALKADQEISRSDIDRCRSQAVAFNKQAEALRSEIKAVERANKDIQNRRDQLEKQMRAW